LLWRNPKRQESQELIGSPSAQGPEAVGDAAQGPLPTYTPGRRDFPKQVAAVGPRRTTDLNAAYPHFIG